MKKWLMAVIVLIMLSLVGCTNKFEGIKFEESNDFKTLTSVNYPNIEYENSYLDTKMINSMTAFTNSTVKELFINDDRTNEIYSPISLYIALSMLLEGCKDDASKELKELLNIDDISFYRQELKKIYNNNYYKNDYGQMRMANSLWVKNDYQVNKNYIDILQSDYYADMYSTIFDRDTNEHICDWINHYTNDLLDLTPDNYPLDSMLVLLLLNTVYFDNKWANEYKKNDTYNDIFYGLEEKNVDYMKHTISSVYHKGKGFISVVDYFKNNNSITYILPDEKTDIKTLLSDDIIINMNMSEGINVNLTLSTPKVKYNKNYELNDNLKNLGVKDIFTANGNITIIDNKDDLYVSFVKQNAAIEFNEDGVKAAAVTSIGMKESVIVIGDSLTIVLNRPFLYVIKDSNGIILFVGIVYNV